MSKDKLYYHKMWWVSQAAIPRSPRATATPPCRPISRRCPDGKAMSAAASTRRSRAPSRVRKAVKWNSPFYGAEDQRWSFIHCFAKYIKVAFFRARCFARSPPERPSRRQCATSTSVRMTGRRGSIRRLGEASQPTARRTNVSDEGDHRRPNVTKQRRLRTILAPSAVAAQALP